jgi:hypothetical protein
MAATLMAVVLISFSACSGGNNGGQSSQAPPTDQAVVGNEETQQYAQGVGEVKRGETTDPYTGTQDQKNFVGQHDMADKQTAGEHMTDKASEAGSKEPTEPAAH